MKKYVHCPTEHFPLIRFSFCCLRIYCKKLRGARQEKTFRVAVGVANKVAGVVKVVMGVVKVVVGLMK